MSELQPYQKRVVDEKVALDDKRAALNAFIGSSTYAGLRAEDRTLLRDQQAYMQAYSHTLGQRIERFQWPSQLEQALIDLTTATDGQGRSVILFHSGATITAQSLREAVYTFMENFDREAVFLNGLDPTAPQGPAEAAAWRNLALLARATAAAIEEEGR